MNTREAILADILRSAEHLYILLRMSHSDDTLKAAVENPDHHYWSMARNPVEYWLEQIQ